jgi:threonine-phosphate decarboxylase
LPKHTHGGRIFEAAKDLGISFQEILDFSANINPQGQPKGLKDHLFKAFAATVHYPDVAAESLVEAISSKLSLPPQAILAGAGSTPHIRMLSRFLAPHNSVILGPAFAEYEESLNAAGCTPQYVLAKEEKDFLIDPELVEEAIALKPTAIILANPANPTGRLVPLMSLEALLEHSRISGTWVVIDEAFIDFTYGKSLIMSCLKTPRLIVLRSLTKIFAIPGLRLAFLVAHPDTISSLSAISEPWPINYMALEAGLYCLKQDQYIKDTPLITKDLREKLTKVLTQYACSLIESDANFVLSRFTSPVQNLIESLYQEGILLRNAANFIGLRDGYLRFAVRPQGEIQTLSRSLEKFYARTA